MFKKNLQKRPTSKDSNSSYFPTVNDSGKRALVLAISWFLFSFGSYLSVATKIASFFVSQPSELLYWRLGISGLCLCSILALLCSVQSSHHHRFSTIIIAPCLIYLIWAGTSLEYLSRIELDQKQDIQIIEALIQSESVEGQAMIMSYSAKAQACSYVFKIQTLKSTKRQQKDISKHLLATTWQANCTKGLEAGHSIWFKGSFSWSLGHSNQNPKAKTLSAKRNYLRRRGISLSFKGEIFAQSLQVPKSILARFRTTLQKKVQKIQTESSTDLRYGISLIRGLVLGESGMIDQALLKNIRASGLGHLLAVSGLHVGICAYLFAWVLRRIAYYLGASLPGLWSVGAMVGAAWFYVGIADYPMSAQRAALMLTVWGIGQISFWSISALESLWITAWLLTIRQPSLAQEMGLQLSILATLGLHSCLSKFQLNHQFQKKSNANQLKYAKGLIKLFGAFLFDFFKGSLQVAWVSWYFTLPIFVWHLGIVNLISIPINAVVTPLLSLTLIPVALVASLLCPIWDWPLVKCIEVTQCFSEQLLAFSLPLWGEFRLNQRYGLVLLGILFASYCWQYAQVFSLKNWAKRLLLSDRFLMSGLPILPKQRHTHFYAFQVLAILMLSLSLLHAYKIYQEQKSAMITFLYVGQGDATLIKNEQREYALFDVGPASAARSLIGTLKQQGIKHIRWIAISHLHPDHYGALETLLDQFIIDMVVYHGRDFEESKPTTKSKLIKESAETVDHQTQNLKTHVHQGKFRNSSWAKVKAKLLQHNIPLLSTQAFQHRLEEQTLGQSKGKETITWGGLKLHWVISSFTKPVIHHKQNRLKENDASLALLITGINEQVLLSGDLEKQGEEILKDRWLKLLMSQRYVSIWQANHHGSRTSSSEELIDTIKPRELIYSLDGLHHFAFPHPEVVRRFTQREIRQIRLDQHGNYSIKL